MSFDWPWITSNFIIIIINIRSVYIASKAMF